MTKKLIKIMHVACKLKQLLKQTHMGQLQSQFCCTIVLISHRCAATRFSYTPHSAVCQQTQRLLLQTSAACHCSSSSYTSYIVLLPARRRPQGIVIIGVCLSVCLSVCLCVRTVFVRKISQERVHGSPPNLVGGSRG